MLNLIIVLSMFFLLVFSTFLVIDLPFITFLFANIPQGVNIYYSNSIVALGTFQGSLQIPIIILSSLLLNPRLNFIFICTYYAIGFYSMPIFYSGGGSQYLGQPTVGYLFSFLPATILLSKFAWKDHNYKKYLLNTRYIFFLSFMTILFIHLIGILTAFFILGNNSKFLNIFQAYFYIPFLSQILLAALMCIIASNLNNLKFNLLTRYKNFMETALKKSTTRRRLAKKTNIKRTT